jgi:hypothetical protein
VDRSHEPDTAAFELKLADTLDHDFGIATVAAMADVRYGDFDVTAYGFRMRPAHRVNQSRLARHRYDHIAGKCVPFPVPGEPQHAGAKAPMAWTAGNNECIELVLAHLRPHRAIPAFVFVF